MSDSSPQDDLSLFTEALALSGEERVRFLDRRCQGNPELKERVETLLRAHERAGEFLAHPPPDHPGYLHSVSSVGEKPGDRIDRYKLLQLIGEGGCGVVFMAEQLQPVQRKVALKIIKPGMDTKSVIARFEAERQVLALMDHPNIAKVFDAGATESGRPYFVMELIRGRKITEYCDENELSTSARLELVIQVCHAIQHAHQKGIIHRDIKPSNILVTSTEEGKALPVIIDFGIAKATNNQTLTDKTLFTAFEQFLGTPAYMSPEQAALTHLDVDTRSDLYSMGVMLYELLTGSTPFDSTELFKSGLDEIRRVIREVEPARPSTRISALKAEDLTTLAQRRRVHPPELVRSLQGDLDWVVMKALEKERSRRYQSAGGLAADLERYLANETVTARPPSTAYRVQKFAQRNKLLCISLATILCLILCSLVVILHSLGQEREARKRAQTEEARSRQTTQFLKSMLEGVGPSVARGRDTVMLREILDKTAGEISHALGDQPAVEAEMRALMARLYLDVGNYEASESMARSALQLHLQLGGSNHVDTASDLHDWGAALLKRRHLVDAEGATTAALQIRGMLLGSNHVDVARSLTQLGAIHRRLKRLDSAEMLTRQGLEIRRRLGGNESLEVADSLRNLSIILADVGRRVDAEKSAREMLALRRRLLGNEHPLVASALTDLAWILGNEDKTSEVEELETEAFEIQMKMLPREHPDVAKSIYSIGERLRERGKWNESQSVLTAALSIQRKLLGEDHPDVQATLLGLVKTVENKGDWVTSETIRESLLQHMRTRHGDHSPEALEAWSGLMEAVRLQNRLDRMEQHLNALLSDSFRTNPASARFLAVRANLRGRQGRWKEVIPDVTQAATLQPDEHYHIHTLAAVLVATGSRTEYERLCAPMLNRFGPSPNPYVSDRIARAITLWPGFAVYAGEAEPLADTALVYGAKTQDAPLFQLTKSLIAYRLGRSAEAREWGEKAATSSHPYIRAQAQCVLAMIHGHEGKRAEARLSLDRARSFLPLMQHAREAGDFGDDWILALHAWILWKEASSLVEGPSADVTIP